MSDRPSGEPRADLQPRTLRNRHLIDAFSAVLALSKTKVVRMNAYGEKSRSCWMETLPRIYPRLEDDILCDVAVIGSGIAGLSTAYELTDAGLTVVVVDRGPIARGMTARTSAHLTSAL